MQTLVALSLTKAKIIALSATPCEVIHLQHLLHELQLHKLKILSTKPQIKCHTFEDNAVCIEVAKSEHKIHPCTKHLAVCLFHFHNHVEQGLISIEHVPSHDQLVEIFTKPLLHDQDKCLCNLLMGWPSNPATQHEGM